MSQRKTLRTSRWPREKNAFQLAMLRATKLTPAEVAETMAQANHCFARVREGVATEEQHTALHTVLALAMGIEDSGVVKGLREHLDSALRSMDAVRDRALASGAWCCAPLFLHELDAIATAVELHEYQLRHVSSGELQRVTRKLVAQTLSRGGAVTRGRLEDIGMRGVEA